MAAEQPTISDAAVVKATGHTWDEWFALLDADDAQLLPHTQIASICYDKHGASGWWAQSVTVEYERARGLRAKYEKSDGFSANASKTIHVAAERINAAWEDPAQRAHWLADGALTLTGSTAGKVVRATWQGDGGGRIEVYLTPKDAAKCQVAVQHKRLANAESAGRLKHYWVEALARLKLYLEGHL